MYMVIAKNLERCRCGKLVKRQKTKFFFTNERGVNIEEEAELVLKSMIREESKKR